MENCSWRRKRRREQLVCGVERAGKKLMLLRQQLLQLRLLQLRLLQLRLLLLLLLNQKTMPMS